MFDKDIILRGKHATYAKSLCPTQSNKGENSQGNIAVFGRVLDVYMTAAIVGLVQGLRADVDDTSSDDVRIFTQQLVGAKLELEWIYHMIVLIDNSRQLDIDDKISYAFRGDNEQDNLQLFDSYVRGGVEWLYNQFDQHNTTHDQYISMIHTVVDDWCKLYLQPSI
jgi:hypothetical protein